MDVTKFVLRILKSFLLWLITPRSSIGLLISPGYAVTTAVSVCQTQSLFSLPLRGHSIKHYYVTTAHYILYNVQTAGFIFERCHLTVYVCLQTFQLVFINSSTILDLIYEDCCLCIRCRMLTKNCFVWLSLIGYVCMSACRPPLGEKNETVVELLILDLWLYYLFADQPGDVHLWL